MKHSVKTIDNKTGKCLYEADFSTPEAACEEYQKDLRLLKSKIEKGEEISIVRLNDGYVMEFETVRG